MSNVFSVVNKAVTTIHNCEEEPIHIPGSIQPGGFLFAVHKNSGQMAFCSENIDQFLDLRPVNVLKADHRNVLPASLVELLQWANENDKRHLPNSPSAVNVNGQTLDCFVRDAGALWVVECLFADANPYNFYEIYQHSDEIMKLNSSQTDLRMLCGIIAEKIRVIIDFDRVMIYRFDEDYNGHVYAESLTNGVDSFLDLHYPHTDIPKQARDLYLRNKMRAIPDVFYTPVPILTAEAELAKPESIDLSNVLLRSVSPIHIQYLKNMGVGATFTISLIREGRLWGLVACHHNTPKQISYTRQVQAFLLSQILTSQITVQETAEDYRLTHKLEQPLQALMRNFEKEENFVELYFSRMPEVSSILNASGAALFYHNRFYLNGKTPPEHFLHSLRGWLVSEGKAIFSTNELGKQFPDAAHYSHSVSGLMYHRLNESGTTSMMWFRSAHEEVITWAGNPERSPEASPLSPRSSFAAWKQMKKGIAQEWKEPEQEMAFRFIYILQRHMFQLHLSEEELRYRKLNEQLLKANGELQNINWISTHDLKEPLRKIQVFASMLNSPANLSNLDHVKNSIDRIRSAAVRMQKFIDDLLLYSKMSSSDSTFEAIDLNEMLELAIEEFKEEHELNLFTVRTDTLPTVQGSRFQMQQLFINLLGNAIKFRKEDSMQHIDVRVSKEGFPRTGNVENTDWYKIEIEDDGVGFDMVQAESIFEIFKRAHNDPKITGTGVGLSICRKIMENHGGKIVATGEFGEGATFTLYFPIGQ